jgi:hypothetical protein
VDAADGLGDEHGNVDRFDFVAMHLLDFVRDGVRDDDLHRKKRERNRSDL